ncbi:hypothetical protein Zmor_025553 [Zophobas morio]|uniref:Uncharacterized protein n=1 Tax=Zophobas morio TaxID=2755281 RepID=A0AA38HS32_9CUCU|nr:hypothetical protein Zmor_025553 [Zophobas morio]
MTFRVLCLLLLLCSLNDPTKTSDSETSIGHLHKRGATQIVVMHPASTFPKKREDKRPKKWDRWSKWSPCSVSCGAGKITRWRHCVAGGCAPGEKEAQIKTCTLNAC